MRLNRETKTRIVHAVAVLLALIAQLLPKALSFSVVYRAPNEPGYEKIVHCNYAQVLTVDRSFFLPLVTLGVTVLLLIAVAFSFRKQHLSLNIVMVALSSVALVTVLIPIYTRGVERLTPTSLMIAYLLLCSVVCSVQHLTGRYFIDPTTEEG